MSLSPRDARVEFPILKTHTYLNSCSLGALSHRAEMYLDEFRGCGTPWGPRPGTNTG